MDDEGGQKEDIKLPDSELGEEIKSKFEKEEGTFIVTVLSACGQEKAIAIKPLGNK